MSGSMRCFIVNSYISSISHLKHCKCLLLCAAHDWLFQIIALFLAARIKCRLLEVVTVLFCHLDPWHKVEEIVHHHNSDSVPFCFLKHCSNKYPADAAGLRSDDYMQCKNDFLLQNLRQQLFCSMSSSWPCLRTTDLHLVCRQCSYMLQRQGGGGLYMHKITVTDLYFICIRILLEYMLHMQS